MLIIYFTINTKIFEGIYILCFYLYAINQLVIP